MGRVLVVDAESVPWTESVHKPIPGAPDVVNPATLYKMLAGAKDGTPGVALIQYPSGHFEPIHSHPHDEVLFIMDGGGFVGKTQLRPGMLLYIERDTEYGPLLSEGGMRFLRVQLQP